MAVAQGLILTAKKLANVQPPKPLKKVAKITIHFILSKQVMKFASVKQPCGLVLKFSVMNSMLVHLSFRHPAKLSSIHPHKFLVILLAKN